MARDPAPRWPRASDGSSRPTSARQAGSSAAVAAWKAGLRSQSATGASASRPDVPKHWALATTAPCSLASPATSVTRRVFPTPAPPRTSAILARPAVAVRHRSWSRPSSADLPTSWAAAGPERPNAGLIAAACSPAWGAWAIWSAWAIKRCRACRVAGSGTTPSSRSRTDAQWW